MADSDGIEFLASFEEITTLAINMPGCKAVMYYTDASGVEQSIEVDGIKKFRMDTDARVSSESEEAIKTREGGISIAGEKS